MRTWLVSYRAPDSRADATPEIVEVEAHSAWSACFTAQRHTGLDARAIVSVVDTALLPPLEPT